MKIQGGPPTSSEVLIKTKNSTTASTSGSVEEKSASRNNDKVDAQISQSLQNIESAIQDLDLNLGGIHSNLNEERLKKLFDSFDRVESKRPEIDPERIFGMLDRLESKMSADPQSSKAAFREIDPQRVADLLS